MGEDLAGGGVDDGDDAVVDGQFHRLAGVFPADVDDDAAQRGDDAAQRGDAALLGDASASVGLVRAGRDGHVHGPGPRAFGGRDAPASRGRHASGLAVFLLVAPGLFAGGDLGVGAGLALGFIRLPGGAAVQGPVGAFLVVLAAEPVELGVELVEAAREGPCGEPLLEGAVPAFDLALGLGMVGAAVLPAHAHQGEQAFERPRFGRVQAGRVHGAVVGERGGGDAVPGARLAERLLDGLHGDRRVRARVQEEPGVVVEPGDDERVRAVRDRPVGEVRLPRLVGQRGLEPRVRGPGPLPRLGAHQARLLEDAMDRGVRRRPDALALQPGGDGLRPRVQTGGVQLAPERDDPLPGLLPGPVGDTARAPGTGQETFLALLAVPASQLVRPLPGDAVAPGGLGDRHAREDRVDDGLVAQELATGRGAIIIGMHLCLLS